MSSGVFRADTAVQHTLVGLRSALLDADVTGSRRFRRFESDSRTADTQMPGLCRFP
ncbi:hypothetical protein ACWEKR_29880 [Nocardia sp. NPDC004573]